MNHFGLKPASLLLPTGDLTRWAVIACDQYTSEPAYWQQVEALVGDSPSALRVTLPEIYLQDHAPQRIAAINETMTHYLDESVFAVCPDSMMYIERQTSGGVRRGLLGLIDLEDYDYRPDSHTLIRATEQTVVERIPPRVAIRRDAPLELPHVLLLVDDPAQTVIAPLTEQKARFTPAYDFDLMMGGGHIAGWQIDRAAQQAVDVALRQLVQGQADPLLFAVGDGNHSLATAKECYRLSGQPLARYALVEVVNIHDPSIQFEPIYRVLFSADVDDVRAALCAALDGDAPDGQVVRLLSAAGEETLSLRATAKLPVGTLQTFLDAYLVAHPAVRIDYIHGEDALRALAQQEGAVGFLFDGMKKEELFPAIRQDGSLPRKTFSMGHAADKRYYVEARAIR